MGYCYLRFCTAESKPWRRHLLKLLAIFCISQTSFQTHETGKKIIKIVCLVVFLIFVAILMPKMKQATTNVTGPPKDIWMFCLTMEHKSTCDLFFWRYSKNITKFLFWVLWTCLATSIKSNNVNFFIYLQKMISVTKFLFEILQTYYFDYFENAWSSH